MNGLPEVACVTELPLLSDVATQLAFGIDRVASLWMAYPVDQSLKMFPTVSRPSEDERSRCNSDPCCSKIAPTYALVSRRPRATSLFRLPTSVFDFCITEYHRS